MPTATTNGADRVLHEQLRDVRQRITDERQERSRLQRERERDAAREAFAHVGRGERAARELNECHDRLEELADEEGALLGLLGGGSGPSPASSAGASSRSGGPRWARRRPTGGPRTGAGRRLGPARSRRSP